MAHQKKKITVVVPPHMLRYGAPVYRCSVVGCASDTFSSRDGLTLFPLPKNPSLAKAWEENLQLNKQHNRPRSPRVCFRHFKREDFIVVHGKKTLLSKNAVPIPSHPVQKIHDPESDCSHFCELTQTAPSKGQTDAEETSCIAPEPAHHTTDTPGRSDVQPAKNHPEKSSTEVELKAAAHPSAQLKGVPKFTYSQHTKKASVSHHCDSENASQIVTSEPSQMGSQLECVESNASGDLDMMEIDVEPVDDLSNADENYHLTLEDILEELPWVSPSTLWSSEETENRITLVLDKGGHQKHCKKVVIGEDLKVCVYYREKRLDKYDNMTLSSLNDLKKVLLYLESLPT